MMAMQVSYSSSLVEIHWEFAGSLWRDWRRCYDYFCGHTICTRGLCSHWRVPASTCSVSDPGLITQPHCWGAAGVRSWSAYQPHQICQLWEPTRLLWSLPSWEVSSHGQHGGCAQGTYLLTISRYPKLLYYTEDWIFLSIKSHLSPARNVLDPFFHFITNVNLSSMFPSLGKMNV